VLVSDTRRPRVTAADVAREAGVSRATVGFVMNKPAGISISAATAEKVLAAADRLGYRPHIAAQALARGRSNIVLLVLPDWPMEHTLTRHLEEAERVLSDAGYSMVTYTRRAGGRARPLWQVMDVDVVVGFTSFPVEELKSIRAAGVARVVPEGSFDLEHNPWVSIGAQRQVQHLVERGHHALAFAGPDEPRLEQLAQLRQRAAVTEAQLSGVRLMPEQRPLAGRSPEAAEAAVRLWVEAGITGVVAFNDEVAAAVVNGARRAGIAVPRRLAVIGHDDTPLARLFSQAISSVRVGTADLGGYLAAMALAALDGREAPALPVPEAEVVVRATT
jgi:DNA-binding LacI/PurR family transcriptional regulator